MADSLMPDLFQTLISMAIEDHGVYPHRALIRYASGHIRPVQLDSPEADVLCYVAGRASDAETAELIFGLDRRDPRGQECVAGAWYRQGRGWVPFAVPYGAEGVQPVLWDDPYWAVVVANDLARLGITDVRPRALCGLTVGSAASTTRGGATGGAVEWPVADAETY